MSWIYILLVGTVLTAASAIPSVAQEVQLSNRANDALQKKKRFTRKTLSEKSKKEHNKKAPLFGGHGKKKSGTQFPFLKSKISCALFDIAL